jgi:threonine aldolase
VETNIVIFEVATSESNSGQASGSSSSLKTAPEIISALNLQNIRVSAMSDKHIRMVTHLDVTPEMVQFTAEVLKSI